jgi:thymidine kinase
MANSPMEQQTQNFLKSLGFPALTVHDAQEHFDFTRSGRRILVIGPMGSGKTEFSSRVWRDSRVALTKSDRVAKLTTAGEADRRRVFFIRSMLDKGRFPDYPEDALAFRGGYERLGDSIAHISNSFELEEILDRATGAGTWIIDESSFYDERIAYVVTNASKMRGLNFIFPTLILNFRKDIFNHTARLLLETATEIIPLTAYCEHPDCIVDSFYTYRYYSIDGEECPALYFDPLIIVGGDTHKDSPLEPNYCTRCDEHHYLPGKEYTYLHLKPLGEKAAAGDMPPLTEELFNIKNDLPASELYRKLHSQYDNGGDQRVNLNALKVPLIAERALIFLYGEQNLLTEDQLIRFVERLELNRDYLTQTLANNRRPVNLDQKVMWDLCDS